MSDEKYLSALRDISSRGFGGLHLLALTSSPSKSLANFAPLAPFYNVAEFIPFCNFMQATQATQKTPASALASSMLHRMINSPMRAYRYNAASCLKLDSESCS